MTSRRFSDFLRVLLFFVAIEMGTSITVPELTLCAPDGRKTCFACCPPIRPASYEHIQHKSIIQRVLRENTLSFQRDERAVSPITGFSCWALGYPDKEYRRIGCLLHPAWNNGMDLRYRVDYGNKCSRESCPESKAFACLDQDSKRFWLALAEGLDSFSYSSRLENPLFFMLRWGPDLLQMIASVERHGRYGKDAFFEAYPFFQPCPSARAPVYLAKCLIKGENVHLLKNRAFSEKLERFSFRLCLELRRKLDAEPKEIVPPPAASNGLGKNAPVFPYGDTLHHVHRLPLDRDFLDYLRLIAGIKRIDLEEALLLKRLADEELARFRKSL